MVTRIERGQRLYVADGPDSLFEGALLDVDLAQAVAHLDPIARLTLHAQTKSWVRAPLPKGPARVAPLAIVHDEENEARHFALNRYASPLGRPGTWVQASKRTWTLTPGQPAAQSPAGEPPAADQQAAGQAPARARPPVTVRRFKTRSKSDSTPADHSTQP